jgi:hypothetical protein
MLATGLLAVAGSSGRADDWEGQFWSELNLELPLNQRTTAILKTSLSSSPQYALTDGKAGLFLDYIISPAWDTRVGFTHTVNANRGPDTVETRLVTDMTYSAQLHGKWRLADRNRLEFRWINGVYSTRYRNRIRFLHPTTTHNTIIVPYASFEAYINADPATLVREEYSAGIITPLNNRLALDTYLTLQVNQTGWPQYVDALGVTLTYTL